MKHCSKCDKHKPRCEFHNSKAAKDGLVSRCKECISDYQKDRNKSNPQANRDKASKWRLANQALCAATRAAYRVANADYLREWKREWRKENPSKVRSYHAKRRAARLNAIPSFIVDNELNTFAISEAYHLSRLRRDVTNFPWHVDHVVPLQSDIVCGLHWYANLRVIPGKENQSKSNKYWENMP